YFGHGFCNAKAAIKRRIWDVELQEHLAAHDKLSTVRNSSFRMANYLSNITIPKFRRAFTLARFNALPSRLLEGRYQGLPVDKRVCPCDEETIETIDHVLLECSLYRDIRRTPLQSILQQTQGRPREFCVQHLLGDKKPDVTEVVAKFCAAA
ncbi:hypothetical protein JRQ81_009534, partial [Phrynocephalus forsythii]